MTAYYYTDRIVAAYMARDFGLEFVDEHGNDLSFQPDFYFFRKEDGIEVFGPFYFHPDSLPLLEPKVGDIVTFEYDVGEWSSHYTVLEEGDMHRIFEQGVELPLTPDDGAFSIIQRDGKPFFWPESGDIRELPRRAEHGITIKE